jgi:serine protease AprX
MEQVIKMKQETISPVKFLLIGMICLLTGLIAAPSRGAPLESYIVQGRDVTQVAQLVQAHGGQITAWLPIINGVGARLPATAVTRLRAAPAITVVTPNSMVRTSTVAASDCPNEVCDYPTADYSEVVGANQVWAEGITGQNVTVAVIDTGIDETLPGILKYTDNSNREVIWQDFVSGHFRPIDPSGHGSHVAGIIANSRVGGADGMWNGVAPNVDLVGVRVLNEDGMGWYEDVIEGIQWVVDNRELYNIKVMNLSLVAAPAGPYWADPLNQAVMRAWAEGITVVAAAGNDGPNPMTVGVPGNNPYVITVGAFTDSYTPYPDQWEDDYLTPFSAAGPTLDSFVKPDVIAPGAHMVSTMMSSSRIAMAHEAYKIGGTHFSMAGTSQATGVVSGIAALILSHDPGLTPDQVKYRLMHTALLWTEAEGEHTLYSMWQQGAGRVNAPDAVLADIDPTAVANYGLDITADLADPESGYEGYTYYDEETGEFRLQDDPGDWPDGYSNWNGQYTPLTGGYGAWTGGYSAWAGGYSAWAGGFSAWAGGFSAWAGGFSAWAGGYSAWAGGYSAWAGSEPWAGLYDGEFAASFAAGYSPDATTTASHINRWVEEEDWIAQRIYLPVVLR